MNKTPTNWNHLQRHNRKLARSSFQRSYPEHSQFDQLIEVEYKRMMQKRKENPKLLIPNNFHLFLSSKSFKELLSRVVQYMELYVEFEEKYRQISAKEEGKFHNQPMFKLLRYETGVLEEKCKEISFAYMGIILGYGNNKLLYREQNFFETMLYVMMKILHRKYVGDRSLWVDEQLNRIFRTNTFNLIKRRHEQDEILNKHPTLKETPYDGSQTSLQQLQKKLSTHKKYNYISEIKPIRMKGMNKPADIDLSTYNSMRSRSPLIACLYPSEKQKMNNFTREVRQKDSFIKTAGSSQWTGWKRRTSLNPMI